MPTCPTPLWPSTDVNVCGTGGTCVDSTYCSCPTGWTGLGDFQYGAPTCAMNMGAIRGLWSIVLAVHALALPFSLFCVFKKFVSAEARARYQTQRKKDIHGARAASAVVLIAPNINFFFIATAALRISDANLSRTIGTDPAITVCFSIGTLSFWSCVPLFAYYFLHVALRHAMTKSEEIRTKSEKMFAMLKMLLPIIWIMSTVACIAPLFALGSANRNTQFAVATVHYGGLGLAILLTPLYILPKFIRPMTKDINQLIQSRPGFDTSQLQSVTAKLNTYMRETTNQGILNFVACCVFCIFPYCSNWSSYWLALAWIGVVPIECAVLYLIAIPAKHATSNHTEGSSSVHVHNKDTTASNTDGGRSNKDLEKGASNNKLGITPNNKGNSTMELSSSMVGSSGALE